VRYPRAGRGAAHRARHYQIFRAPHLDLRQGLVALDERCPQRLEIAFEHHCCIELVLPRLPLFGEPFPRYLIGGFGINDGQLPDLRHQRIDGGHQRVGHTRQGALRENRKAVAQILPPAPDHLIDRQRLKLFSAMWISKRRAKRKSARCPVLSERRRWIWTPCGGSSAFSQAAPYRA
jgi:hypothetical protein